jgi:hypothetical protein
MHDTNAPFIPPLPRNLETFYNPKPGDKSNIALLTHRNDVSNDKILAYPYREPGGDIEIISDDVEF